MSRTARGVPRRAVRHAWDLSPAQAVALQRRLRHRVEKRDRLGPVRYVAGVDVGPEDGRRRARAAVVVLALPDLEVADAAVATQAVRFPYVPGLLSFRELPVVLDALKRLRVAPDLLLCDGQGYAHPRRFGIACHLGVITGLPAIGVGKSRLVGVHGPVPARRGAWVPLRDGGERIGAVLRTRAGVRPVYVSIGHRVGLATAIAWVLRLAPRFRLPETTRQAHRLASGGPAGPR